jgi:tetratricopeptide (TPR) repeat protein
MNREPVTVRQQPRALHPDIERLIDQAWRLRLDDTRQARGAAERALALAQARDDPLARAWASLRLVLCDHILARDEDNIEPRLHACIASMHEVADVRGEAEALNLLGTVLDARARHDAAFEHHERCRAMRESIGDMAGVCGSLNNGAISLRALGRIDEALAMLQASLSGAQAMGDPRGVAYAEVNLGGIELLRGNGREALRHHELAFAAAVRTDDRALECTALTGLARSRLALGDLAAARELLSHAQALAQRTGNVRDAARVCLAWALVEHADLGPAVAEPHLQAALLGARQARDHELEAEVAAVQAEWAGRRAMARA